GAIPAGLRPRCCKRLQNRVEPHDHSRSARCQRDENKKSALSCRAGPVPCEYSSSSPGTRNPSGTRYLRCGLCLFRRGGGSRPEKALSGAGVQPPSHQPDICPSPSRTAHTGSSAKKSVMRTYSQRRHIVYSVRAMEVVAFLQDPLSLPGPLRTVL